MFEQELITLGLMADRVAPPLRRVLAEISVMKEKVLTWEGGAGHKNTDCKYDPTTHNVVGYIVRAESGNLGNLVHELTHVAVNESFGMDFVNYPNPNAQNVPVRQYYESGLPKNEFDRQTKYMDNDQNQLRIRVLDDLIAKANAARACLGDHRWKQLVGQFNYGRPKPHLEFDTVINQTFVWLHEWASDDMKGAESRTERAMLGRVARPGSNPTSALSPGLRPRSYAVGSADDARATDLMQSLFDSLARQVDQACDRRELARLARPRSYAVGSADEAKARAT